MTAYLYGYGSPPQRLTEAQLETKTTWRNLDPEFKRRLLALFDAGQDVGRDVGIGGGWRSSAQQEALFRSRYHVVPCPGQIAWNGVCWTKNPGVASSAPPGRSYHETTTAAGAIAADLIGDIAWAGAVADRYGLFDLSGVNSEPWHFQPMEVPTARRNYDGAPLARFRLPDDEPPPPPPPPEDDMAAIAALYVPTAEVAKQKGDKTFLLRGDGGIRHASGPDVAYANSQQVPTFQITSPDHYDQLDVNARQGLG